MEWWETMTRTYRWLTLGVRALIRIFFRRVEILGLDNLPASGGGLLISWHPNGLVDPALILAHCPRPVVIGARHGLFQVPLLGTLMRRLGCVPIYRAIDRAPGGDEEARRAANRRTLDTMAQAIADGSLSLLFPEGDSHDEPRPLALKVGAARLYLRARELMRQASEGSDAPPAPVIVPVGLHYDQKQVFFSRALMVVHPPLTLPRELIDPLPDEASDEERREQVSRLTAALEDVLESVVYATDSWDLNRLMHRARRVVRTERAKRAGAVLGRSNMAERVLGFARLWAGYRERVETHPRETQKVLERVRTYDEELRALGLADSDLDGDPPLRVMASVLHLAGQLLLVYLLLPPILLVGYVVNLPTALGLRALARRTARRYKDEATIKLLVGALAFPATWLLVAVLVAWGQRHLATLFPTIPKAPIWTGVLAFVLSAAGGVVALHYSRLFYVTRRAVRVRLTRARRRKTLERLRQERAHLCDAILHLAVGLDLPGAVAPDGRIVERDPTPETAATENAATETATASRWRG